MMASILAIKIVDVISANGFRYVEEGYAEKGNKNDNGGTPLLRAG